MRYDPDAQALIVDDDYVLPVKRFDTSSTEMRTLHATTEMRSAVVRFENRWGLSIIWGSMTYSTNHDHPYGFAADARPDFVEDPTFVEVGILMPQPVTVPAVPIGDVPGWRGPTEFPAFNTSLWGDPLGWVDATQLRWLARMVNRFRSDGMPRPDSGPELTEDDAGQLCLVYDLPDLSTYQPQEAP